MVKNIIREIVQEGQTLASKQSWVCLGYKNLMAEINRHLAEIPNLSGDSISFPIREWKWREGEGYCGLQRKITARLSFSEDASLELRIGREAWEGGWTWECLGDPSAENIRVFAGKLQKMLEYFLAEIRARNEENTEAGNCLENMFAQLQTAV